MTWTYNWKLSPGPLERSSPVDFMPMVPGTFKRHCFFCIPGRKKWRIAAVGFERHDKHDIFYWKSMPSL